MQSFSDWVQFGVSSAVVILFLAIILCLVILITKRKKVPEPGTFDIEHLNKKWRRQEEQIRQIVTPHKEFSKFIKEREKSQKNRLSLRESRRKVFVVDFEGDMTASACAELRDIITVLLNVIAQGDEIVVRLESVGGVVHGYGLAASQLARITERKIPLTVCVDKVAASGGYMMACVANKIVAAPFSIIGSIGVLSSMPNFSRLLKKHDVDYIEQTAGEYKRTLTLFGELTDAKKEKHQQNIDIIHKLFKDHVSHFRPKLDISTVATGDIWPGRLALELGLVDELKTSDDLLLELGQTADIYLVKNEQEKNWKSRLMKQFLGHWSSAQLPLARFNDKPC